MENNGNDRNQHQIIRKDARNCFVETKSDSFPIGKIHLEFATYDASRPAGQRQTNHVNIYIDFAEFMSLAHFILHGSCHAMMRSYKEAMKEIERYKKAYGIQLSQEMKEKQDVINRPLYQSLGGTSAERLAQYGRPRKDGKSLSRNVKLFVGSKADYLLCAESGPGETDAKGLIVPKYGNKPEQKVSVSLSLSHLNEIMLITLEHYKAWLSSWYAKNYEQPKRSNGKVVGSNDVMEDGSKDADDMQMF